MIRSHELPENESKPVNIPKLPGFSQEVLRPFFTISQPLRGQQQAARGAPHIIRARSAGFERLTLRTPQDGQPVITRPDRMSAEELRATISLSSIFGLRMLGMFVILPVFAIYAETLPGGDNLTLVGMAIGAYGLTQAMLQIPFGWWSDRYGRKPVICAGLAVFAVGSFVAAAADNIYVVILGRVLQGAGAVSAAVIAMVADLTREEHRHKAMAMIGSTIGATFAVSLAGGPWLNAVMGVPGIFALTGVLAAAAIVVV